MNIFAFSSSSPVQNGRSHTQLFLTSTTRLPPTTTHARVACPLPDMCQRRLLPPAGNTRLTILRIRSVFPL
jgi:hypothetical protein